MAEEQDYEIQECSEFIATSDHTKVRVIKEIAIPCPNCDKDITLDDIKALCPGNVGKQKSSGKQIKKPVKTKKGIKEIIVDEIISWEEWIQDAITCFNKYRKKVGINTCNSKAHFLAQLAHESDFINTVENFNYSTEALTKTLGKRFHDSTKFKFSIKVDGKEEYSEVEKNGIQVAREWGRPNGADATTPGVVSTENQENIANWAYQNENGHGDFASGDGYRYSGKGFIQLTWKSNYKEMTAIFNNLIKELNDENNKKGKSVENEANVDWVNNPDNLKFNSRDAMAASLAFWQHNKINELAIYNSEKCVKVVTYKVNVALDNLKKRIALFKKTVGILKVNECKKETWSSNLDADRKGTVVVVSGIGRKAVNGSNLAKSGKVVYETSIYKNTSLDRYKQAQQCNVSLKADKTFYLARDAHKTRSNYSNERYGIDNEAPPGEYYLVLDANSEKYEIAISDDANNVERIGRIKVNDQIDRTNLAINGNSPNSSLGELTTGNKSVLSKLIELITDLYNTDTDAICVRIIIEEREVEEGSWTTPKKGETAIINKWTGVLPTPKLPDTAQIP